MSDAWYSGPKVCKASSLLIWCQMKLFIKYLWLQAPGHFPGQNMRKHALLPHCSTWGLKEDPLLPKGSPCTK